MDCTRPQDYASELSNELWAKVLSLTVSGVADESDMRFLSPKLCLSEQARFYRLRLVCKRFNDVFVEYPHLCRGVVLKEQYLDSLDTLRLASLVAWLLRYCGLVRTLAAYGGTTLSGILATMADQPSTLQTVLAQRCNNLAVQQLSRFDQLTTLELVTPMTNMLNVSPLQHSSSLQRLVMQNGSFNAQMLPPHLTSLHLAGSELTSARDCSCVTSLRKLKLSDSKLYGIHRQGLPACVALEGLTCLEGCISADAAYRSQSLMFANDVSDFQLPVGLSALTCLASLDATVATDQTLELLPFYQLTSLQDLSVHVRGADMIVNQGLSALSRLTSLTLLVSSEASDVEIIFGTDWTGMQLQVLDISCDLLNFGYRMLGLIKLPHLRQVNFVSGRPHNDYCVSMFAALVHGLATKSRVHLRMNGTSTSRILEDQGF